MTAVDFHTGVADPVHFACRLLRKAMRQGARLQVSAPEPVLAELDRALWIFDERDFIPHVRVPGPAADVLARTPIWLSNLAPLQAGASGPRVLVNLGAEAGVDLSGYERLIEIVALDVDAAQAGRERWREYKARGFSITHHAPRAHGR